MFAAQDQGNRRAGARGLTRNHHGGLARRLRRAAAGTVCAAAVALPLIGATGAQAATSTTPAYTTLKLVNGWTNYGSGTAAAAVASINGIVHLKGAIKTAGINSEPFTLPVGDRPAYNVYVPVDMCGATNGRLIITPSGAVTVQAETSWADAQCFTSLEGVTFARSANSFTALTLQPGWTWPGFGTAGPAARNISGIVHLEGSIATGGTNPEAFTLPAGDAPATDVYVPVDMCAATNGRLDITPTGEVVVEAEGGAWTNAQCFTSLDGVSFATSPSSFTPLTLVNGWTSFGGTAAPAARVISGVVHLQGGMYTTGTNPMPFTLPAGFRPAHDVYVKVDLGGQADNGRLFITPSGSVTVEAEGSADAQGFASLDGASFAR